KARNMRSLVPPANRRPPPVASTGPQLNDGKKGYRRPILAAPQARTELGGLVGAGLARFIDIRPGGFGIETLENVLAHVGLAGDEVDLVVGALELPEVTVARDVDEALHGSSIPLVVERKRRRGFVLIPGIVGMILEVAFDRAA